MPRQFSNKGGPAGARRGSGHKRAKLRRAERQRVRETISVSDYIVAKLNGIDPATGHPFTDANRPSERWFDRLAIMAAPFFHPRLAPVGIEETPPEPKGAMDLTKLNDDELADLERILTKSQVPLSAERFEEFD